MLMAARNAPTPRRTDPTPQEIAALCREIQLGWTDAVREKRRACKQCVAPWTVPEVDLLLDTPEEEFWWQRI
jgi:hypothetical protein